MKCSFYVCECIGKMPNYSLGMGELYFFGEGSPSPRIELRVKRRENLLYFTLVPEYP